MSKLSFFSKQALSPKAMSEIYGGDDWVQTAIVKPCDSCATYFIGQTNTGDIQVSYQTATGWWFMHSIGCGAKFDDVVNCYQHLFDN